MEKKIKHLIDIVARDIVSIANFSITFEINKWLKINSIYLSKKKKNNNCKFYFNKIKNRLNS